MWIEMLVTPDNICSLYFNKTTRFYSYSSSHLSSSHLFASLNIWRVFIHSESAVKDNESTLFKIAFRTWVPFPGHRKWNYSVTSIQGIPNSFKVLNILPYFQDISSLYLKLGFRWYFTLINIYLVLMQFLIHISTCSVIWKIFLLLLGKLEGSVRKIKGDSGFLKYQRPVKYYCVLVDISLPLIRELHDNYSQLVVKEKIKTFGAGMGQRNRTITEIKWNRGTKRQYIFNRILERWFFVDVWNYILPKRTFDIDQLS